MKTLVGLGVALILSSGLFAQRNGNGNFVGQPVVKGGFGNVVFPGGTAATVPGIQRNFNTFVSPLGSGPHLVIPRQDSHARRPVVSPFIYSYPMFVGGGYGYGYGNGYGYGPTDAPPPEQQPQGGVTVIYPPQPAPVIINQYGAGDPAGSSARPRMYEMPAAPPQDDTAAPAPPEATHYLLAFKDHTIYSAVAYWVDGETLHYFTSGNTHNQASLSLIDHDLTVRLNRESGVEIKLPAVRQ